jgi:23S rRNA G2069 N7-methylase RlmK/C1962 C5-methylase RlmI
MSDKDRIQGEFFRNRVSKNERQLRRWARKEGIEALRLYDRDIPEVPLALDRYGRGDEAALVMALYERPYEKDEAEESDWLDLMALEAAGALGVDPARVFIKTRKRQRGLGQYERNEGLAAGGGAKGGSAELWVREGGLSFLVNLSDYLDTGLFLDHRPTRALVRSDSKGRDVLNLFSYTGSFSVYAAGGGALSVTSVDLSNTYLAWAGRNLERNGFSGSAYPLIRSDVRAFLEGAASAGKGWDLIVVDPPTFSNSKMSEGDFDLNRDWPELLSASLRVLRPEGKLYFSTNSRRLKWDGERVPGSWEELSEASIPPDFRDRKAHRCWRLGSAGAQ